MGQKRPIHTPRPLLSKSDSNARWSVTLSLWEAIIIDAATGTDKVS